MSHCLRCEGLGWEWVDSAYPRRLIPDPSLEDLAKRSEAEQEAMWAELAIRRAGAAQSVMPCRACEPDAFMTWAGGHWASGHVCGECRPGSLRSRGPRSGAPTPVMDRRDLD